MCVLESILNLHAIQILEFQVILIVIRCGIIQERFLGPGRWG